jgi:uncharacterized protein YkwD
VGSRRAASAVLLAALTAFTVSGPAFGQQRPEKRAQAGEPLPAEIEVTQLINEFRAGHGLTPHRVNAALCRAARKHSENMARHGSMSHVLDGKGPGERAVDEGFAGPVAENCAAGNQGTPRAFFDLWVASAAHRANMLRPEMSELGVGFARAESADGVYCTAMFGASR